MYDFSLTHGIGPGERNGRHDLAGFGRRLERAGGLDPWPPHAWPMAAFPEAHTSDGYMPGFGGALRSFQIRAGLDPDGVARPGGPTERALKATLDPARRGRPVTADEVYRGAPPGTAGAAAVPADRPADGGAKAAAKIRKLSQQTAGPGATGAGKNGSGANRRPPVPTVPPPGVRRSVGAGGVNDHGDLLQARRNLARVGYAPRITGLGEPDGAHGAAVRNGLRAYQQAKGLKIDGLMRPGGPTERALHRQIGVQQQRLIEQAAKDAAEAAEKLAAGHGEAPNPKSAAARTLGARMTGAKVEAQQREAYAEALGRMKRAAAASSEPEKPAGATAGAERTHPDRSAAKPPRGGGHPLTRKQPAHAAQRAEARERAEAEKHAGLGGIEHEAAREDRFNVVDGFRLPKSTADLYFRILKATAKSSHGIREDIRRAPLGKFQKSRLYLLLGERLQRPDRPLPKKRAKRYLPYLTESERRIERLREASSALAAGTLLAGRPKPGRNRSASARTRNPRSTDMPSASALRLERYGLRIPGIRRSVSLRMAERMLDRKRLVGPSPSFEIAFGRGALKGIPLAEQKRIKSSYTNYLGEGGERSLQWLLQVAGAKGTRIEHRLFEAGGARFGFDAITQFRFEKVRVGNRTKIALVENRAGQNTGLELKTGPGADMSRNQRIGHAATDPTTPATTVTKRPVVIKAHHAQFLKQGFHEANLKTFQRGFRDSLERQGHLPEKNVDQVMRNLAAFHRLSNAVRPVSTAQVVAFTIMSVALMAGHGAGETQRIRSRPDSRD